MWPQRGVVLHVVECRIGAGGCFNRAHPIEVEAAARRLAVLMASLVAILGLLPASVAKGLGTNVQRPLATVIVWGLFSSLLLTLFVVPVLYRTICSDDRPAA